MDNCVGDEAFCWDDFDAMPDEFRHLLCEAPFDFGTESLKAALKGAKTPERRGRLFLDLLRAIASQVRAFALETYGPTHPQAGRPVVTGFKHAPFRSAG